MTIRKKKTGRMAGVLAAVLALTLVLPAGVQAQAATDQSRSEFEELVSEYAVSADKLGYDEYVLQHDGDRPDAEIGIDAGDYVRYEEADAAARP